MPPFLPYFLLFNGTIVDTHSLSCSIYNPTSKIYVVWADGAGTSGYLVGTSSSPASGYKAAGVGATDPAYASLQKADMAVEVISGSCPMCML
jgi:hypothetical protein